MKIDILFISFNRKEEIIYNINIFSNYEQINNVIWVDNGSSDGSEKLAFESDKIVSVRLIENIGIKAYNIGAEKSNADLLIVLDDDSHIDESIIPFIKEKFSCNSKLGILAMKILLFNSKKNVTFDWKKGKVPSFWGCGFVIRRELWNKLGGYNEVLFLYTNEYDLAIRTWAEGYQVEYDPDFYAYHRVSDMNRNTRRLISLSVRNNFYFIKTYFSPKYHNKLLFFDRLTWLTRAILSKDIYSFFYGLKLIDKKLINNQPVDESIQKFYMQNLRIFENPLKKVIRKFRDKSILNKPKAV